MVIVNSSSPAPPKLKAKDYILIKLIPRTLLTNLPYLDEGLLEGIDEINKDMFQKCE